MINDFEIPAIDFHTHCFPDFLAPRAIEKLSAASGNLLPGTDGTVADLRRQMKEQNVTCSCVMNIATNPKQMCAVNDFAASIAADDIVPFGSVHPDSPDALDELDRIASLGLLGVKFHPDYQSFYADDSRMIEIYRKISRLGLAVLFHAGLDIGFPPPYHGMPSAISRAMRYLDTVVIAAHWGGVAAGEEVLTHLAGSEVYLDTSFGYGTLPPTLARKIIEKHGTDKILFASDTPWHSPQAERRYLDSLSLTEGEKKKILYQNAEKLLNRKDI